MTSDLSHFLDRIRHPGRTPRLEDIDAWLAELDEVERSIDSPDARSVLQGTRHRLRALAHLIASDHAATLVEIEKAIEAYGPNAHRADIARARLCAGNAHYALGDFAAALHAYEEACAYFDTEGDNDGLARAIGNIGNIHNVSGEPAAALARYNEAYALHESMGDVEGMARTIGGAGLAHANMVDHPQAMACLTRSLDLWRSIGNTREEARMLNGLANVYREIGEYATALEHFHSVLSVVEEAGDLAATARILLNIAGIYGDINDNDRQLEYCLRAIEMNERTQDKASHPRMLASLAGSYFTLRDPERALPCIEQAIEEDRALGLRASESIHAIIRASILNTMGRKEEGKAIAESALEAARVRGDHRALYDALIHIATYYQEAGDIDTARARFSEALAEARLKNDRSGVANVLEMLATLLEEADPAQALAHVREAYRLNEEIRGERQRDRLAVLDMEQRLSEEHKLHAQHRELLLQLMPDEAVSRILKGERVIADTYDDVSVMFLDIVGFTALASQAPAGHLVHLLNAVFELCDSVCDRYDLTKIKTIGDSYMAIAGMPAHTPDHVIRLANAALELSSSLRDLDVLLPSDLGETTWANEFREIQVRIGLHCGPVVAGVIGKKRAQYDVWGDTVNVASRMESTSSPGQIQVSDAYARALQAIVDGSNAPWRLTPRGETEIKGKGTMATWWLEPSSERPVGN